MRAEDFERLYATHAADLFGFLVYRTGNRAVAEDLLADTFERVLRARRRFDPRRGSEKTWLYAIALNCLRDHLRREEAGRRALKREQAGPRGETCDDGHTQIEARELVRNVLQLLSDEERDAIALRFGADLTVPEIARLTGEALTTVEGRVYRALRKLRNALASAGMTKP